MKKNMRKVAALGLCVALGATMLTACGGRAKVLPEERQN